MIKYNLRRANRLTVSIQVKNGEVIVYAPKLLPKKMIDTIVNQRSAWIERNLAKQRAQSNVARLTEQEKKELAARAKKAIPERVAYYAPLVGVDYGRITIRTQKTRWGSCSSKGNLNFNCLLMLAPPEVLDSVVVHELCHRKHMNHSKAFYKEVLRVMPDYYEKHAWLKKNGSALMKRAHG